MNTVTSKDGTRIAFDQSGRGPALILVSGAIMHRGMTPPNARLAAHPALTRHFTVIDYDRRGRGDSADTQPFAIQREIEDIEALIDAAGGTASLFGISSGAALAMHAAIALPGKVKALAMYEPPYNADPGARAGWQQYRRNLTQALAEGRRGDAVGLFMTLVGMPPEQLAGMRQMPAWPMFEAVAPTLAYDGAAMGDEADVPLDLAARVPVPTLVMNGGASYPFMHTTAVALAQAIPDSQQRTLDGQTHEVTPDALAPVLVEFFSSVQNAPRNATRTTPRARGSADRGRSRGESTGV